MMFVRGFWLVVVGLVLGGCAVFGDSSPEVVVWDFSSPLTTADLGGRTPAGHQVGSGRGDVDIEVTFPNGIVHRGVYGSVIAFAPDAPSADHPTLINSIDFETIVYSGDGYLVRESAERFLADWAVSVEQTAKLLAFVEEFEVAVEARDGEISADDFERERANGNVRSFAGNRINGLEPVWLTRIVYGSMTVVIDVTFDPAGT